MLISFPIVNDTSPSLSSTQPIRAPPIPQTPKGIGYRAKEKSQLTCIPSSLRGGLVPKAPSFGVLPPPAPSKAPLPSSSMRSPTNNLKSAAVQAVQRPASSRMRAPLIDITPRPLALVDAAETKAFEISTLERKGPQERNQGEDFGKRVQDLLANVQDLHDAVTDSISAHRMALSATKAR